VIVPLEMSCLAMRKGYASPELVIGWRIGNYVREFFGGLDDVLVAVRRGSDAALALSLMTRSRGSCGAVAVVNDERPWDFLFYHSLTGTMLQFSLVPERTELSPDIRSLEPMLSRKNPRVMAVYHSAVEKLAKSMILEPVESFCSIREIRCRPFYVNENKSLSKLRCPRCGSLEAGSNLWDVDGVTCCLSCSGLENSWFDWN